jgi:glycogen phosphorylase
VGEDNIFLFGNLAEDVEDLRHHHFYGDFQLDPHLKRVFETIRSGTFGDAGQFSALVNSIVDHGDYYLVSDDFKSYIDTQKLIDEAYRDQDAWLTKTITSVSRMGFFSSDRCIDEYAEMIWNVEVCCTARYKS